MCLSLHKRALLYVYVLYVWCVYLCISVCPCLPLRVSVVVIVCHDVASGEGALGATV